MTIVLPIVFAAAIVGLSVRRMTPAVWSGLVLWIVLVITYNFLKH